MTAKTPSIILIFFLISITLVSAHVEHKEIITQGKALIAQNVECEELTDNQLEAIGEYFMEQMHPEKEHEEMDAMMGGEGSKELRQMHINMAQMHYCNGMMGGMTGGNDMMNGGMMNMMMGGSMMGGQMCPFCGWLGWTLGFFSVILLIAVIVLVILLIIWLIKRIKIESRKTRR